MSEAKRLLRTGKDGYLEHSRGLVGAVAYWACGSMALAVMIIAALACGLLKRV